MIGSNILETSTSTGTGDFTLAGAGPNRVTFASQFATGEIVAYTIRHGSDLETGWGALANSTTLERLVVTYSTNSNAKVSFGAGTKEVYCTPSAGLLRQIRSRYVLLPSDFDLPNSADWAVNAAASVQADSVNTAEEVLQFTEAAEMGAGRAIWVPPEASYATIRATHRPETSPGGSPSSVQVSWYNRPFGGSWTSAYDLTPWTLAASSTALQTAAPETLPLAALGLTAGAFNRFEITRQPSDTDDPFGGVWNLRSFILEIW